MSHNWNNINKQKDPPLVIHILFTLKKLISQKFEKNVRLKTLPRGVFDGKMPEWHSTDSLTNSVLLVGRQYFLVCLQILSLQ